MFGVVDAYKKRPDCSGTHINHTLTRDIKSAIITAVEKYESN